MLPGDSSGAVILRFHVQVTGGRDGKAIAWDVATCTSIAEMIGHKGHVTATHWFTDTDCNVFLTGAQVMFVLFDAVPCAYIFFEHYYCASMYVCMYVRMYVCMYVCNYDSHIMYIIVFVPRMAMFEFGTSVHELRLQILQLMWQLAVLALLVALSRRSLPED